ncbi:gamma-glutamyl-gamma-aminobutyrate hydrolase family protein [Pimelobacter simplex]|uniref:gamma-glutamyl-gamma-aminobutyrate hydrolase family protein n=1 Tax=Nocardioides simplex TaxID=2045 RepID=UPI003AAE588D
MSPSPIIGITYSSSELDEFLHWRRMFHGIVAAGATPVAIDCSVPVPGIASLVGRLDGLVVSGGGDVAPELYGGDPADPEVRGVNVHRDTAELTAIEVARALALPILTICRGTQLLNVALGGTLIADIRRDRPDALQHRLTEEALVAPLHAVTISPGSRLARWTGRDGRIDVNSQHHQGIAVLGSPLAASAASDDGLVEGIEIPGESVVGVQWHPEVLWSTEEHASRLLAGFTEECLAVVAPDPARS